MSMTDELPALQGGAKALLLTVFGEFVLPEGGAAWTSSLVAAAQALGVGEKNARQAIARIGDQGLIESSRHGRSVQWSLTADGHDLLESGTRRIYGFGTSETDWNRQWLLAHCPVPEAQRTLRNQLRTELGFLGFGEISPSLLISPHTEREPELREVLRLLELQDDSVILRSTSGSKSEDVELASRAWNLDELAKSYVLFCEAHQHPGLADPQESFRSLVGLVHDWRRFPFTDPELPSELLPQGWSGTTAAALFQHKHAELSAAAKQWFANAGT